MIALQNTSRRQGPEGGYRYNAACGDITLEQVAHELGVHFVEMNWRSGMLDKPCLISSGMACTMDGLMQDLNAQCMNRLTGVTIGDVEKELIDRWDERQSARPDVMST